MHLFLCFTLHVQSASLWTVSMSSSWAKAERPPTLAGEIGIGRLLVGVWVCFIGVLLSVGSGRMEDCALAPNKGLCSPHT